MGICQCVTCTKCCDQIKQTLAPNRVQPAVIVELNKNVKTKQKKKRRNYKEDRKDIFGQKRHDSDSEESEGEIEELKKNVEDQREMEYSVLQFFGCFKIKEIEKDGEDCRIFLSGMYFEEFSFMSCKFRLILSIPPHIANNKDHEYLIQLSKKTWEQRVMPRILGVGKYMNYVFLKFQYPGRSLHEFLVRKDLNKLKEILFCLLTFIFKLSDELNDLNLSVSLNYNTIRIDPEGYVSLCDFSLYEGFKDYTDELSSLCYTCFTGDRSEFDPEVDISNLIKMPFQEDLCRRLCNTNANILKREYKESFYTHFFFDFLEKENIIKVEDIDKLDKMNSMFSSEMVQKERKEMVLSAKVPMIEEDIELVKVKKLIESGKYKFDNSNLKKK